MISIINYIILHLLYTDIPSRFRCGWSLRSFICITAACNIYFCNSCRIIKCSFTNHRFIPFLFFLFVDHNLSLPVLLPRCEAMVSLHIPTLFFLNQKICCPLKHLIAFEIISDERSTPSHLHPMKQQSLQIQLP